MGLFNKSPERKAAEARLDAAYKALEDKGKRDKKAGIRHETPEFNDLNDAVCRAEEALKAVKRRERGR
ncbi:hypothetical protein [Actinocatenispora rupis]|uniref:Lacal_2735 family protein n=1 Tax=Actinocatenispora rupis TaxID=519421 RepID=A0A8J3J903_9ACTN|nr:hypothetical protein [Actinocatenispora rupis]GID14080.1 hypothetical protein Aru02nite_49690 [Actinocatenispora rupis]